MTPHVFRTAPIADLVALNESQGKVPGFDLKAQQSAHWLIIGAGGLGTHVGLGLVRKGPKQITICDEDHVQAKNLTRQLFGAGDVRKNKAACAARRLSKEGFFPTTITAHPCWFQQMIEDGLLPKSLTAILCCVDNQRTRVATSIYGIAHGIPVVHCGVSHDGDELYCFVQESKADTPCFCCAFPEAFTDDSVSPCGLPGIIDVLQVVAGVVVFAADTLISKRHRSWNKAGMTLSGTRSPVQRKIARNPHCPLCGEKEARDVA